MDNAKFERRYWIHTVTPLHVGTRRGVGAPIYVEKYIVEQFFQNLVANPNKILINKIPIQGRLL